MLPSCLKVNSGVGGVGWGGAHMFLVGTNLGFELGCTGLRSGQAGFGTKGFGTGLDNLENILV